MNIRPIILLILLSISLGLTAQEKRKVQFNYGIKAGFQAVTYNDPEFEIDGYVFDTDNIQSNRIGYAISPFVRLTKNKFFIIIKEPGKIKKSILSLIIRKMVIY